VISAGPLLVAAWHAFRARRFGARIGWLALPALLAAGVELVGFATCDAAPPHRAPYRYLAGWRLSDAGLGCPDWPGCYGHLIGVPDATHEQAAALKAFPLEHGERITLEYVLLQGVTDSLEDGRRLAAFARQFPSKVNLIPFNPHEGSGFEPPTEQRVGELMALLAGKGITVSVRRSRGQDVAGACGQLARRQQR